MGIHSNTSLMRYRIPEPNGIRVCGITYEHDLSGEFYTAFAIHFPTARSAHEAFKRARDYYHRPHDKQKSKDLVFELCTRQGTGPDFYISGEDLAECAKFIRREQVKAVNAYNVAKRERLDARNAARKSKKKS